MEIETRPLGRTGLVVSALSFGILPLSPLQGWRNLDAGAEVIARASGLGLNLIDTAQFYRAYPVLREGLRRSPKPWLVASKTYAFEAQDAYAAADEARYTLDRDVIDIFLLHEQEGEHTLRGHREALDALYTLKARGVIGAVGLSTHHVAGVRAATAWGLDVVHPLINIDGIGIADGGRGEMEAAIMEAASAGLGLYAMKALGGGLLHRKSEAALAYARSLSSVHSVALGMRSIAEVEANVSFWLDGRFKTPEIAESLRHDKKILVADWCSGCGACAARCPQNALTLQASRVVCDDGRCLRCGYCGPSCKNFCIKIV